MTSTPDPLSAIRQPFRVHRWRHELGNYAALRLTRCDGAIVSMHQSGTHWLKFMLANAMALHYGVEPPCYNHANDIIGGTKDAPPAAPLPHLISTHSIAPLVCQLPAVGRFVRWPPTILLVRDFRESLVSNYRKWRHRYGIPFSDFLRGDVSGRRFNSDIWWCVRFQNAWGAVLRRSPRRFLVVRYEDLSHDAHAELARVTTHLGLAIPPALLHRGVVLATRDNMAARADPERPPGEVNPVSASALAEYGVADRAFIESVAARMLHEPFGYAYDRW